MRVLLDGSVLRHGLRSGTAQYCFNLAEAMLRLDAPPDLRLWFGARESAQASEALAHLQRLGGRILRAPAPWSLSPDGAWWLPFQPSMDSLLAGVDVYHLGEFVLPRHVPAACVATVHDLTTLSHPAEHTRLNRVVHSRRLRWIERHADAVIAVSEATRHELLARSRVPPERTAVVHEARATPCARPVEGLTESLARYGLAAGKYILAVGTLEPRKNHQRLLEAFESLPERHRGVSLVLAGGHGWRASAFRRALARSPARERVRVTGFVPAADLPALYAGATLFAFPSLYEGFGLPLLEAMAAEVPVLTSDISSMPEVTGNAAVLVDPTSTDSIRSALLRLLDDSALRSRLAQAGAEREKQFTWRRTAEQTLQVYERALAIRSARNGRGDA